MSRLFAYGYRLAVLAGLLLAPVGAWGQEMPADSSIDYRAAMVQDMIRRAGELRRQYRFADAVDLCEDALSICRDSIQREAVSEALLLARNGENMTEFCSTPTVVAQQRFSREDFFLSYPLEDGAWRPVPNVLDSLGGYPPATYIPEGAQKLYYAARDAEGISNLYVTENQGKVWSAPQLLGETLTSSDDEIFPWLSPDGKALYFASRGMHGMGGFDMYVSRWSDEQREWQAPVNLGFPYSSPADDFLFMNTPDGRFSLFATNRSCPPDSVDVYVVEYESMPVRQAVYDPQRLQALLVRPARQGGSETLSPALRPYIDKLKEINILKDSLTLFVQSLDQARVRMTEAEGVPRQILEKDILRKEQRLPEMEAALSEASQGLQEIEMELILAGIDFDPGKVQQAVAASGASSGFSFVRHDFGPAPDMVVLKPKPSFDYSFMILPEGRFAQDNKLPDGLVYQILLFSATSPATVQKLRGLSPVFEKKANGAYVYSVGVFRTYQEALSQINRVKKAGFKKAFITAYQDGGQISVTQARKIEQTQDQLFMLRLYPASGNSLGEGVLTAVRAVTQADLVRSSADGTVTFLLGPFSSRAEAESTARTLRDATGLRIEPEPAE